MPNATAPNAPWVDVWLSPHAIVIPGCVSPSSGPMTCTIPWRSAVEVEQPDACFAAVALERGEHVLRHDVHERPPLVPRRDDVVDRRERAVRIAHPPARARAACRTPAGSSPHAPGEARRRAASARSGAAGQCGRPRLCRKGSRPLGDGNTGRVGVRCSVVRLFGRPVVRCTRPRRVHCGPFIRTVPSQSFDRVLAGIATHRARDVAESDTPTWAPGFEVSGISMSGRQLWISVMLVRRHQQAAFGRTFRLVVSNASGGSVHPDQRRRRTRVSEPASSVPSTCSNRSGFPG